MNKAMILLLLFVAVVAEELVRAGVFTLLQGVYLFILFLAMVLVIFFVSKRMAPS